MADQADLLGIRPGSHGCVGLTIPDARRVMEHVPVDTAVEVFCPVPE
ncbi:L,D-transpeptidase [uncultured Bifidobacterium sp.]